MLQGRHSFTTTALARDARPPEVRQDEPTEASQDGEEQGAFSRRLSELAQETIDTGSKSDHNLMQNAGFSEELKKQLEDRIAQTTFAAQNQRAASQVNMPVCAHHPSGNKTALMFFAEVSRERNTRHGWSRTLGRF